MIDPRALERTLARTQDALVSARTSEGHWRGELSSSALSTATAAFALATAGTGAHEPLVRRGLDWLASHQNADGGWGDTVRSPSNLSTSVLGWSALAAAPGEYGETVGRVEAYLRFEAGGLGAAALAKAVAARYGEDRTFSAPILTMAALAGRLGEGAEAWRHVASLPFELAAVPRRWLKWLRVPVVSYALPALVAVGHARFRRRPPRCPVRRLLRHAALGTALRTLRTIQPASGGFLEAAPLTSFVAMSLAGSGLGTHPVVAESVGFLAHGARADGSWPIDTDLATWVTTLATGALAADADGARRLGPEGRGAIREWLLKQQYREEHAYTGAAPGGWAWTDLPGGVPDADDTAGALVALRQVGGSDPRLDGAAVAGVRWLVGLQNRDGGMPTFCRGWGSLPFDRSTPDLTAHAVRAWLAWRDRLPAGLAAEATAAVGRAVGHLAEAERADGAWVPLWFGNARAPDEANPTYGTARVVRALLAAAKEGVRGTREMLERGVTWLAAAQGADGGWGGGPGVGASIEETALAVEALASAETAGVGVRAAGSVERGVGWLMDRTEEGARFEPAPIGLYFARLWYFERLYPVIFTAEALARAKGMGTLPGAGAPLQ